MIWNQTEIELDQKTCFQQVSKMLKNLITKISRTLIKRIILTQMIDSTETVENCSSS